MPVASSGSRASSSGARDAARNLADNAESWADSIFGSGSGDDKSAIARQMLFGGVSGWVTGFLAMKVGKAVAFAVGGGIIIMQIANHQGYIKINWSRLRRDVDNVANKIAEGDNKKNWTNKLERKLEQLSDRAEDLLDNAESRSRRWYNKLLGREARDLHIFLSSFAVGTALGVAIGG